MLKQAETRFVDHLDLIPDIHRGSTELAAYVEYKKPAEQERVEDWGERRQEYCWNGWRHPSGSRKREFKRD